MEIFSADRNSHLTISRQEAGAVYSESFGMSIVVEDCGFRGTNGNVWVERGNYERFLVELQRCDATRSGEARFARDFSDEFEAVIACIDSSGHFELRYRLSHFRYQLNKGVHRTVSGAFDLDSSEFASIVDSFASLLPPT